MPPRAKETTKVPAWKAQPLPFRLMDCVRMLAIHQMLSERERDKAVARIRKRFAEFR